VSVYVDPMMPCVPSLRWRWTESCHLFADSPAELHLFAARLGLQHSWFQNRPGKLPHYDLTSGMRACFVLWLASNTLSAGLHFATGMFALGARDVVFFALAIHGLRSWRHVERTLFSRDPEGSDEVDAETRGRGDAEKQKAWKGSQR